MPALFGSGSLKRTCRPGNCTRTGRGCHCRDSHFTREELRQKVWPEDTFVDFDQALNTAIAKIRTALGDDAENPRFVETLPRRGYRFIGPVDQPSSQVPTAGVSRWRFEKPKASWTLIGVAAALFALVSGIAISRFLPNRSRVSLPPIDVLPLASLPGFEVQPAFSPDGSHVAFALRAEKNSGLYTTMVGGEKSLRLTNNSGDCCPTWSHDGRGIAFSRMSDEGVDIYVIPALGGTEHRVFSWPPEGHRSSTVPPWRINARSLDWSPDGKVLAFADRRTRLMLGLPCFRSPIPRYDPSPHRQARTSTMVRLSRRTVRR